MPIARWPRRAGTSGSRKIRSLGPRVEGLEGRALLSADPPGIVMDSATTVDSRSVTFEYDVRNADLGRSVEFGVYRSADDRFDASDVSLGAATAAAPASGSAGQGSVTVDDEGRPATAEGHHRLTVPLPQGLPPNPEHPYVLVVADPSHALSGVAGNPATASFRTFVVGVVTHGGIQPKSWKAGVPWALRMADSLRAQGYDAVIPYNWVTESRHPGAAAEQGPRLGRTILNVAERAPAGEPVDLHLIGHSEGTVVNSLALRYVATHETPALGAGYVKETLLDPHAANNDAPGGRQYSVKPGLAGDLARWLIDGFQQKADDPLPVIRADVDQAEVFYQHTPIAAAKGSNGGLYNLWGQVPVPVEGNVPVHYYNLTGVGISHGGDVSVPDWYQAHVVPTLGDGSPFVDPTLLTGGLARGGTSSAVSHPIFEGTAAPGAQVRLLAVARGTGDQFLVGQTKAGANGGWVVNDRSLPNGTYHVIARSVAGADPQWPRVRVMPRTDLGPIRVDTTGWRG